AERRAARREDDRQREGASARSVLRQVRAKLLAAGGCRRRQDLGGMPRRRPQDPSAEVGGEEAAHDRGQGSLTSPAPGRCDAHGRARQTQRYWMPRRCSMSASTRCAARSASTLAASGPQPNTFPHTGSSASPRARGIVSPWSTARTRDSGKRSPFESDKIRKLGTSTRKTSRNGPSPSPFSP